MASISDSDVQELVKQWEMVKGELEKAKPWLDPLIEKERQLRQLIVGLLWPIQDPNDPNCKNEGTRRAPWGGKDLEADVKVDRKVMEDAYQANHARFWGEGINPATMFRIEHKLDLREYRALPEDKRKIVDEVLTIKPGSPTLELVAQKEKK